MLWMIALAASSPQPVTAPQEELVCRKVAQRTALTFFHYRREKVCATKAEWKAADFRQARLNDAEQPLPTHLR